MKLRFLLFLVVVCVGCARYVDVTEVEFSVKVRFENNKPVFATTYNITVMNTNIQKVIKDYKATVAIVTDDKRVIKEIALAVDVILPKQVKQVTITENETEEAIRSLFNELEIHTEDVIRNGEAALVLPSTMVKVRNVVYTTQDVIEYFQEVSK